MYKTQIKEIHPLAMGCYRQLSCSSTQDFLGILHDVRNGGANCGFSGFIYHNECKAFFLKNKKAIIQQFQDDCNDLGEKGILEMVASFNCLRGDYSANEIGQAIYGRDGDGMIYSVLAWFALESVAFCFDGVE